MCAARRRGARAGWDMYMQCIVYVYLGMRGFKEIVDISMNHQHQRFN